MFNDSHVAHFDGQNDVAGVSYKLQLPSLIKQSIDANGLLSIALLKVLAYRHNRLTVVLTLRNHSKNDNDHSEAHRAWWVEQCTLCEFGARVEEARQIIGHHFEIVLRLNISYDE